MGNTNIGGIAYTTYVFTAQCTPDQGTLLAAGDIAIYTATGNTLIRGALGLDIENVSGSGSNAKYTVNLDGSLPPSEVGVASNPGSTASQTIGQSVFGDPGAGTFGGFGYDFSLGVSAAANFDPNDITDNPFVTQGAGSTSYAYLNSNVETPGGTNPASAPGPTTAVWNSVKLTGTGSLDSGFEQPNQLVNVGSINNGPGVYALETNFAAWNGSVTSYQPISMADAVPFYQVVVAQGTTFTMYGELDTNTNDELFTVDVPEPAGAAAFALGSCLLLRRRGRRDFASDARNFS
jgi:hypothetical protein